MPQTNTPRAARFWNRIAKKYARDPVADQASYEYKLDQTAKRLTPQMRVLEFACGTGTTSLIHAPRVAHIDATDFSSEMIDIARSKIGDTKNVAFHVSSIEDWPVPTADEAYDVIMAHSILHLVADLDGVLAHSHACLKPGGLLVSSTVCIGDMNRLFAFFLPVIGWLGLIPKVAALQGPDLVARIKKAGFSVEEQWRKDAKSSIFVIARKDDPETASTK